MKKISIYLAGNVRKYNSIKEDDNWREAFKEKLKDRLKNVDIRFLDPTVVPEGIKDSYSVFSKDIFFVANCDFVVVEASNKTGIGTGIEMLTAKMHGVPVIAVVPKDSYYRKTAIYFMNRLTAEELEKWIHPFLGTLSDLIVEDLEGAAEWITEHLNKKKEIKNISIINDAIEYYKENIYDKDEQAKKAFE